MSSPVFAHALIDKNGQPLTEESDHLFPYWSFTKALLATAILRLVDQGRLKLDAATPGETYTLRQLLQHRAGLPSYTSLEDYHRAIDDGDEPWSLEDMLARMKGVTLFSPGQGWAYSNDGYALIRRLIEQTIQADLNSALRTLIFDPVGVHSPYVAEKPEDLEPTSWGNEDGYDPRWVFHGLVVGTALDAARLLYEILHGGLLPRALISEMTRAHEIGGAIPERPWITTGYGLGLMIGEVSGAGRAIGHNGNGPSSLCVVHHYPEFDGRTIAAFTKSNDEGALERKAIAHARL